MSEANGFWVFGYGSLMWRPGFPFLEAAPARVLGYHRALCIYSVHYRGTRARPGLVFGLAQGGACDGMAFRVADQHEAATRAYLIERELVTGVYRTRHLPVTLTDGSHRTERAFCFIAERDHPQSALSLSLRHQAALVLGARGAAGRNLDYVLATLAHLRGLGIRDGSLDRLVTTMHAHAALRNADVQSVTNERLLAPLCRYPAGVAPTMPANRALRNAHRRRLWM